MLAKSKKGDWWREWKNHVAMEVKYILYEDEKMKRKQNRKLGENPLVVGVGVVVAV